MNLVSQLLKQVSERPEQAAIIESSGRSERRISFRELDERSSRVAAFLRAGEIRPGDSVLVFLGMSVDLYVALLGLWRVGAIPTFVDPSAGRRLLDQACRAVQPKALIATSKAHFLRLVSPAMRRIPCKVTVGRRWLTSKSWKSVLRFLPDARIAQPDASAPALHTFTSGSTGVPKTAARSHRLLLAQHAAIEQALSLRPGETDLATLPHLCPSQPCLWTDHSHRRRRSPTTRANQDGAACRPNPTPSAGANRSLARPLPAPSRTLPRIQANAAVQVHLHGRSPGLSKVP